MERTPPLLHPSSIYPAYSVKSNFITFSHLLMTPFWLAEEHLHRSFLPLIPGRYGQLENTALEVFARIFHLIWSVPTALVSLPFHLLGNSILAACSSPHDIEVLATLAPSASPSTPQTHISFLQWNVCAMRGSLPLPFGGMTPARMRLDRIIAHILAKNADVVVLSEIDPLEEDPLIRGLAGRYEKIYYRFGLSAWGMSSCLLVALKKGDLLRDHATYHPLPVAESGAQKAFKRGFFILPAGGYKILFTHLHPGDSDRDKVVRKGQLDQIQAYMKAHEGESFILLGDLNIDSIHHREEYEAQITARGLSPTGGSLLADVTASDSLERTLKGVHGDPLEEHLDHIVSSLRIDGATTTIDASIILEGTSDHASVLTSGVPIKI